MKSIGNLTLLVALYTDTIVHTLDGNNAFAYIVSGDRLKTNEYIADFYAYRHL